MKSFPTDNKEIPGHLKKTAVGLQKNLNWEDEGGEGNDVTSESGVCGEGGGQHNQVDVLQ